MRDFGACFATGGVLPSSSSRQIVSLAQTDGFRRTPSRLPAPANGTLCRLSARQLPDERAAALHRPPAGLREVPRQEIPHLLQETEVSRNVGPRPEYLHQLRGDSPSFEAVTAVVSRAFRDGTLSCAISGHASPPAVSFRRHFPVKLSHWHRPADSVGRLLFFPPHPGERDPMPPVCSAAPR